MPHSVSLSLDHNQEATAEKAVAHDCLRILYVINSLLPGGAESLVSAWASQLHGAGHHVEVCTIYTNGFLAERLERQIGRNLYMRGRDISECVTDAMTAGYLAAEAKGADDYYRCMMAEASADKPARWTGEDF